MLKHLCHYRLNKAIFDVHLKQGLWRNIDIGKEMRSMKDWGGQKVSPCFIPFLKTNEEWRPTWWLTLGIGMTTPLNNSCNVPNIGKQTKVINSCWVADKAVLSIGCAISILLCHLFLEKNEVQNFNTFYITWIIIVCFAILTFSVFLL